MAKQEKRKIRIKCQRNFYVWLTAQATVLIASFVLSLYDRKVAIFDWTEEIQNVMGILSQVMTSIISLIVSIIAISISLQNEEFFGVKVTKIYSLRVKPCYSIRDIIIISIGICVVNLIFYIAGLYIAMIGTMIVALLFLLQVLISEIPVMTKDENAICYIIKNKFILSYKNKEEIPTDLKKTLKYLLYKNNLKFSYDNLQEKEEDEYNRYLFFELLDIQAELAKDIKEKYEGKEQLEVADSILRNVNDVIFQKSSFLGEYYTEIIQKLHLLTRPMFSIYGLPSTSHLCIKQAEELTQKLEFTSVYSKQCSDLMSEILILLVVYTVKEGDFKIIKAIRRRISAEKYCLETNAPILNVFAVISMYLYYLGCCEPMVPDDIKQAIDKFIKEKGIIEENTVIYSWKQLFNTASNEFNVNYDEMIAFAIKAENAMDYYLFGTDGKKAVLSVSFFSKWYISNLFNTRDFPVVECEDLCKKYPSIKPYLRELGEECINENGDFSPTEEMKRIVEFYSDAKEHFVLFKIIEKGKKQLFNFINDLKSDDLSYTIEEVGKVDNNDFSKEIKEQLAEKLHKEYGFDASLVIENKCRGFSIIFEKQPDEEFKKIIASYCIKSIFADLKKAVNKTKVFDDGNLYSQLEDILSKKPKYTTENTRSIMPCFIRDDNIKASFLTETETMQKIKSRILGNLFFLTDDSFRFNLSIEKIEITELPEDKLAEQVAECQREDGRFVYDGVFLSREKVVEYIKTRFVILTVSVRHQIESSKEKIFELNPYSKGEEE